MAFEAQERKPLEEINEKVARGIWLTRNKIHRVVSFLSPAPDIEGIDPKLQERSWMKLIALRIKRSLGEPLSFNEEKKLILSDTADFEKNSPNLGPRETGLDEMVMPLVRAINANPYLVSVGSCSGHLRENPKNPEERYFSDAGFISFLINVNDRRYENLLQALDDLCNEENAKDSECLYQFKKPRERTEDQYPDTGRLCSLSWRWNHPLYAKERTLQEERLNATQTGDAKEEERIARAIQALWKEQQAVVNVAIEKDILSRYRRFIEVATAVFKQYN